MADTQTPPDDSDLPDPEVLSTREDEDGKEKTNEEKDQTKTKVVPRKKSLRSRYRLSHKATFFGLVAAVVLLLVFAAGIVFVVRSQSSGDEDGVGNQVVIDQATLEGLGVNRTAVANEGTELIVGPNARFDKRVQVGGDVSIGGELILNSRLSAADASISNLQAGETSIEQLNVNGDGTLSNLSVREDITVVGNSRLQGTTTIGGLLSVENSANISGNLTVGGTVTAGSVQSGSVRASGSLIVAGRIVSGGSAPSVSAGPATGSNGTVSISGNDIAGTVGVNVGTGGGNGILANITFNDSYPTTPRVIITPVGDIGSFYIFRTSSGFNIGVSNSVSPGGYAFDYFVIQ